MKTYLQRNMKTTVTASEPNSHFELFTELLISTIIFGGRMGRAENNTQSLEHARKAPYC